MAAITFIEIVVGLAVIALIFIPFDYAAREVIIPFALNNTTSGNGTNTINQINNIWFAFPIIVAFGMLYYGIARSQKRSSGFA
jgi:hypothetical protein